MAMNANIGVNIGHKVYILEVDRLNSEGYKIFAVYSSQKAAIDTGRRLEEEEIICHFKVSGRFLNA